MTKAFFRVLFLACSLVLGCSGTNEHRTTRVAAQIPCAKADTRTDKSFRAGTLGSVAVATIPSAGQHALGYLRLWDNYVGFTPAFKAIAVCNLETGKATTIASVSEESPASLDWMSGSRDVVVYSTLSSVPQLDTPNPSAEWTIEFAHLRSGKRGVIARSRGNGGPDAAYDALPKPVVGWPWVAWSAVADTPGAGGNLVVYDLRDRSTRVVARGQFPASIGVSNGLVMFEGTSGEGQDVYVVPADGSAPPQQITHLGTVTNPAFTNGYATWQQRQEPDPTRPNDYIVGNDSIWVASLRGPELPVQFKQGLHPVVGDGFVLTQVTGMGLVAYDLLKPDRVPVTISEDDAVDSGTRWDVDGSLAAWTTLDGRLHLARIVRRTD